MNENSNPDVPLFANFSEWAAATGERPIGWEARCDKCGETFNPSGDEIVTTDSEGVVRVEHYQTEDEQECGGFGPIVGSWSGRRPNVAVSDDVWKHLLG